MNTNRLQLHVTWDEYAALQSAFGDDELSAAVAKLLIKDEQTLIALYWAGGESVDIVPQSEPVLQRLSTKEIT
jgi:hypothetical protein